LNWLSQQNGCKQDGTPSRKADRTCQWLFKRREFRHAVAIDPGDKQLHEEAWPPRNLLSLFAPDSSQSIDEAKSSDWFTTPRKITSTGIGSLDPPTATETSQWLASIAFRLIALRLIIA